MKTTVRTIIGWIGAAITLIVSSIWAYWGAIENFHEGWYSLSLWENLFMLFFQYLLFPIIFTILAVIALTWKKIGLVLHVAVAAFCVWFFSGATFSVVGLLVVLPIIVLALLYYFGTAKPKKWAYRLIIGIPLAIILIISIPQAIKISQRVDDGHRGMQIVEGNGITLVWAPRGPGWPDKGINWDEAQRICRYLSEDGTTVMETEQNIWRLPSVDEAVRSMSIHGANSKGIWDSDTQQAVYEKNPDKESPLWDVHSKVIYYWTGDTPLHDNQRAYIIVYHGSVYHKRKTDGQAYLSFRAVKEVDKE